MKPGEVHMIKGDCSLDLLTYSIQIVIINLMVQIARNCHPESLVAFQFSDINHKGDLGISSGIECKFAFYHHGPYHFQPTSEVENCVSLTNMDDKHKIPPGELDSKKARYWYISLNFFFSWKGSLNLSSYCRFKHKITETISVFLPMFKQYITSGQEYA